MAKQIGPIFFTGCVSDLTFYKWGGQYYVRQKSSLSRNRVLHDPTFKKTMENAGMLRKASPVASKIYQSLDKKKRTRTLYNKLTGAVMTLMKEGKDENEIMATIHQLLHD
ncbi:MAG: hypothetical protein JST75_21635 [Bacteroidetes bacterium]|nr:hypothetical protein [Bacteroidota bacterium]